jgi:predicted Fe-Mo cluster-binding NifX family protein
MKVVISSNGADLDSPLNETFGRCPMFVFVDTETMEHEAVANPAAEAPSGAGIRAAELVAGADIKAVITGRVGPKAMNVIDAAGIDVFLVSGGTVLRAVDKFKADRLSRTRENSEAGEQGMKSPPLSRKNEIEALETEVAALRQKLSQLVQKIEHAQEER